MKKFLLISFAVLTMTGCSVVNRNISATDSLQAAASENITEKLVSMINGYTNQINAAETVYDLFFISEKCYKDKMYFERDYAEKINTFKNSLTKEGEVAHNEAIKSAMDAFEAAVNTKADILAAKKKGLEFQDLTLERAMEKAKAEDKMVFVNFHTNTCGPCKKMEKTVFPKPECCEYINKHFIPITVDGEDNGTGTEIAKKYNVFIYPTYMILSANGFKEGEVLGAEYDVNKFLDMLKTIIHDK